MTFNSTTLAGNGYGPELIGVNSNPLSICVDAAFNPADAASTLTIAGNTATSTASSDGVVRASILAPRTLALVPGAVITPMGAIPGITKWYFEFIDLIDINSSLSNRVGVASAAAVLNSAIGGNVNGAGYNLLTGQVFVGAAVIATIQTSAPGDTIGVAIDTANQLIWFVTISGGTPGLWNDNADADPATGVGGIGYAANSYGGLADFPPLFAAASCSYTGSEIESNFGNVNLQAFPKGFSLIAAP